MTDEAPDASETPSTRLSSPLSGSCSRWRTPRPFISVTWRIRSAGQAGTVNLAAAQQIIDILALLELKTRGNLTAEERQLLEQLVYELRMRYVEVSKAGAPEPSRIIIP